MDSKGRALDNISLKDSGEASNTSKSILSLRLMDSGFTRD
jgi:hypothetical protein